FNQNSNGHPMEIDSKDRVLLNALQSNSRLTIIDLAELIGLSVSGVQKRIKKLEDNGFVESYPAVLSRKHLGITLLCFVEVSLGTHSRQDVADFDNAIQELPEVLECHRLTGGADYLLKIVAHDREYLDYFLMDVLMPLPAVDKLKTSIVLKEIKETTVIPTQKSNLSHS
ncbi:MAG: Lrp/AsnC family transcriptional regulator, partial [Chloroflexota bacterium]